MPGAEHELFDGGLLACTGLNQHLALADRRPFAIAGDKPVWGRDRPIHVEHQRLAFTFDIPRGVVHGVATTTLRPRAEGVREAVLDAVDLQVESVTDEAGKALRFTNGDGKLRIDLGRARPSTQSVTVVVTYSCTPRRGLYFNRPEEAYPGRPLQIWTQGQAEDSPHYFPCLDIPGEKSTFEVIATVPDGWFTLSNGRLVDTKRAGRRGVTYHWRQDVPHSAYLVTLAAGEFEVVEDDADGVPVQYYGAPGTADDLVRTFGRTPEMVRFFADRIGVAYPYDKYATVAIHDFIFGGMENTSATTMTDTLLHDERAHADIAEIADSITAHELAHQWFGDLLTAREWPHAWLHESFATYFDALFVEHQHGFDAFRYDVYRKANIYLQEDTNSYRRPLVQHVYTDPIDIFDRHLYERGSVVLDMLRNTLGDDLWWKAIRAYVEQHRERAVLTPDLQRAIEEATGRNLDWFFDQWVWKGGHPELKASYAWNGTAGTATVTLEQTQQPDDKLTSVYRVPIEIAFHTPRGLRSMPVELTEARQTFVFALDGEPSFVSIDPANRVLKTLSFEPGEAMLRAQLADDPQLMGRIFAAKGLARLGTRTAIEALRTALRKTGESEFLRAEVASALGTVRSDLARDALISGLSARPSRVRRAIAAALGQFAADAEAARALAGLLEGKGDASYYVQSAAADALGRTRDASALATLTGVLGREAHNDVITAAALSGLGHSRNVEAIPTLLDYTQWGVHQNARRAAVDALGVLAPFADEPTRLRVRERLEQLLDDGWLRVQLSAVSALGALRDVRAAGALNAVAARALDGRLSRSARITARTLGEGANRAEDVKRLQERVEQLQSQNQRLGDRVVQLEAANERRTAPRAAASKAAKPASRSRRGSR
ncbi:MAG: M1 family aminopeptidase [Dehalococcoidia bacterium]